MTFHLVRNPYYDSKRANVAGQKGGIDKLAHPRGVAHTQPVKS